MPKRTGPPVLDIYARVSRLGDARMRSTEGQVEDCTARVLERGGTVGAVFVDPGRSAWNPRTRRPQWEALMERMEAQTSDGVVVFDLARFSRKPIDGERLIVLADQGILVLDSEGEYDLTSASGKKHFRDQLSSAAYESDRLSTRVRRGKRIKASAGESNHSNRPFGFESDGLTPCEPEAEELRRLVDRLLAGESQDAMIIDLNARGVATSFGGEWGRAALKQVLTRPRNAGLAEYRGEVVGQLAGGTALVSRDDWEQVCALYAARRRGRPNSPRYMCSGLVVCDLCETPLTGRALSDRRYPDGEVRRIYQCQLRVWKSGCGRVVIDQRGLDDHVRALVVRILADPAHAAAVEAAAAARNTERGDLDAEIANIEHLASTLAARLGAGEMSLERYDAAAAPLERRLVDLRARKQAVGTTPPLPRGLTEPAESLAVWNERWEAASVNERRTLIRQAVRGRTLAVRPRVLGTPNVVIANRVLLKEAAARPSGDGSPAES